MGAKSWSQQQQQNGPNIEYNQIPGVTPASKRRELLAQNAQLAALGNDPAAYAAYAGPMGLPGVMPEAQKQAAMADRFQAARQTEAQNIQSQIDAIETELAGLQQPAAAQVPGNTGQLPAPTGGGNPFFQMPGSSSIMQTLSDDIERRIKAQQAAGGRTLGGAETAEMLSRSMAPLWIGENQRGIDNLFRLFGLGQNAAVGQGGLGVGAAQGMGSTAMAGGQALAQGALGQGAAMYGGMQDLAGLGGMMYQNKLWDNRLDRLGAMGGGMMTGGGLWGQPGYTSTYANYT